MGEEPRSSPFRLYLLSALWSPSHGHTPPLYLYFVIPPLMLLITEESWDSPGPWQEPEEHKSDRILLDSHACSSRCSHCKPSPSCFCLKCAFRTHSPYPLPPPPNCRRELLQRTLQTFSVIPQTHLPSLCSHVKEAIGYADIAHAFLKSPMEKTREIGASEDHEIVNCSSPFRSKNVVQILPVLWAQGYLTQFKALPSKQPLIATKHKLNIFGN